MRKSLHIILVALLAISVFAGAKQTLLPEQTNAPFGVVYLHEKHFKY